MIDSATQHLLQEILAFVDGHVKFAETKNAAVFAFAAGTLFALVQVYGDSPKVFLGPLKYYIYFLVFCFVLAIVCALISFYPKNQLIQIPNRHFSEALGNLLFFEDIKNHDCNTYMKSLYVATDINNLGRPFTRIELMYAEEIIINAMIASRKFLWFKRAVVCVLVGILPPIFGPVFICRLLRKLWQVWSSRRKIAL